MTFGEDHFGSINLFIGALFATYAVFALALPTQLNRGMKAFPRHRPTGLLLTAIALVWSAMFVDQMSLGELGKYKWLLYIITPVSYYLIIQYLDDLLASRALGGMLMLLPTMMVDSARWIPSPSRYVLIITGYVMVIIGIWLVLSPFKFRIWAEAMAAHPRRRVLSGVIAAAVAVACIVIGLAHG